jgi:beta-mannosidase
MIFRADKFIWGVLLDINGEKDLPDNNFDLIPGVPYKIKWPEDKPMPKVLITGNKIMNENKKL